MSQPLLGAREHGDVVVVAMLMVLALVPIGRPAAASPMPREFPRVIVKYADLNLSTDEGASLLLRRIESAARQVCDGDSGPVPLDQWMIKDRCYKQAVARAVASVGAPKVSDAYRAKYRHRRLYSLVRARPLPRMATPR